MKKRAKSRKKLTEEEAHERINQIAMQIQNETEYYVINLRPNIGKTLAELDSSTRFCLLSDGYTTVEQAMEECRERLEMMSWKISEDYARFLSEGMHFFVAGVKIYKPGESEETKENTEEQLTLF